MREINNKYKYFLAVAEEKNMSRAAKRCFISHQGISSSIRQLEQDFGVTLFNRSPKLSLTPSGEMMAHILRQIHILESNLEKQLHFTNDNYSGEFQIGITSSNYDSLVPIMVSEFKNKYPNFSLKVEPDFSIHLEKKLLAGDLDMYIGAAHLATKETKLVPLITESYFFVCSAKILVDRLKTNVFEYVQKHRQGCKLKDFNYFPIISYPETDKLQQSIDAYNRINQIQFRSVFECKDNNVIVKLASRNIGAGIVTDFAIPAIQTLNMYSKAENYLYVFPLDDLITDCNQIFIVYHPGTYLSQYHQAFIDLLCGALENYKPTVQAIVEQINNTHIGHSNNSFAFLSRNHSINLEIY